MNPSRQTFLTILLLGLHASFGFQATSLEEDKDAPKHRNFFRKSKVLNNFDSDAAHYKEERLDQESSLCAIENEKSLACNSKKGKDVCCPGLVCHRYQYWRCVDEENIHCSGPHAAAQECGGWKNSSPFCCEGLVCEGRFCRPIPTDAPTNSPTDAPTDAPSDAPTDVLSDVEREGWTLLYSRGSTISSTPQPELWKNIDKGSYIRRICNSCSRDSHKNIIYKRLTSKGDIDFEDLFLSNWFSDPSGAGRNIRNADFNLFSSFQDAKDNKNPWKYCNYNSGGIGFPRECGPTSRVTYEWNSMMKGGESDFVFYLYTGDGTESSE